MTEIPEHLLKRVADAKVRAGQTAASPDSHSSDPFARRRASETDLSSRLVAAKIELITAIGPVRSLLDGATTDLSAQLIDRAKLRTSSAFTPPRGPDEGPALTLFGEREKFFDIGNGKSVRVGENHARRLFVSKNEMGMLLKKLGKRPLRDSISLARGSSLFVEGPTIDSDVVERVFTESVAERVTNSVTMYEGAPTTLDYTASFGRRYAMSATVVHNPVTDKAEDVIVGIDLLSLDGQLRVEEKLIDDGTKIDMERATILMPFGERNAPGSVLASTAMAAAGIMKSYGDLVASPSDALVHDICGATDRAIAARY